jgi:hypothetical protein
MAGDEGDEVFEQIADIGNEVMDVLNEEGIVVKLRDGDKITGSLVGFSVKKKPGKKEGKEATCSASISVQTKQGVLQIDCETVDSVEAAPAQSK